MRSVMFLLASDVVMVRCIMCIVMLIFAFNDITEGTWDDLWIFRRRGLVQERKMKEILFKNM